MALHVLLKRLITGEVKSSPMDEKLTRSKCERSNTNRKSPFFAKGFISTLSADAFVKASLNEFKSGIKE